MVIWEYGFVGGVVLLLFVVVEVDVGNEDSIIPQPQTTTILHPQQTHILKSPYVKPKDIYIDFVFTSLSVSYLEYTFELSIYFESYDRKYGCG